jgi:hypothetical protein
MPGCGAVIYSGTVGLVRSAGVLQRCCGGNGDNQVHHVAPSRAREARAPSLPEAVSHSSEDSSRKVCRDGDPLCTILTNTMP